MATVVIADDDVAVRGAISRVVRRAGHTATEVGDGAQALARVREQLPDLVLIDTVMPGMSGFELCRQLHADPATTAIPVLTISNSIDPDRVCRELPGRRGAIGKPFTPTELIQQVTHALVGSGHRPARYSS